LAKIFFAQGANRGEGEKEKLEFGHIKVQKANEEIIERRARRKAPQKK